MSYNHIELDIINKETLIQMIKTFKKTHPNNTALDTEASGLNIGVDLPFLIQFGWQVEENIYTYAVDIEAYPELAAQTIKALYKLVEHVPEFLGHNVKFDMHMLENWGYPYPWKNVEDTQVFIRLAHDALTVANGGPPLSLKEYSSKYIDRNAKYHEHKLNEQKKDISKSYNMTLIKQLKSFPNPPEGYKSWTKGALEEFFKDVTATYKDLPNEEMRDIYTNWFNDLPKEISRRMTTSFVQSSDIPYNMLDRETVIRYGHKDIYYTLLVWLKTKPVIEARKNMHALELENEVIIPLYHMERTGFKINKQYVFESKERMYNYIRERKQELRELIGEEIGCSQHPAIKRILKDRYNIIVTATGKDELGILLDTLDTDTQKEAITFIEIIQELRTLEKWYVTYLLRFVNELRLSDRIYTQINQAGTVSGRVTSDFQQFPKKGIKTRDGEPLFNPRQMVTVSGGKYKSLMYLDYSQVELRLQAMYTILVEHPDLNLCRAYMPYKCWTYMIKSVTETDIVIFDYKNPDHINKAYTQEWYRVEDNTPWTPTDVHAATTSLAFPHLDIHSDEFKMYRSKVGKRVNFAKNYGAQYRKIATMFPDLHFDEETLHRIDSAYYNAFPGVKTYHEYCYNLVKQQAYATNLFGVRYYGLSGHKLINCLVQGSGAYFLKEKMTAVTNYLLDNNYKTRFQMNIHDEMSFEVYEGEEHIIFEIQKIMQDFSGGLVPIVADLEVTTTTWAEKKECETLEDVKRIIYTDIQNEND